jgi:hypothetical protein
MRLSAPAMAERYRRGIVDEGADVPDVGMVGREMLYWTVGAREWTAAWPVPRRTIRRPTPEPSS